MPQLQRPGYGVQVDPQQQALARVIQAIQTNAPSYRGHGPQVGIDPRPDPIMGALADPRNAWIGLGPLAMASRPAGWGAEVLRRYKLLGGTPATLNKTLMRRAIQPEDRQDIVNMFRSGTDIAAPSLADVPYGVQWSPGHIQENILELAGNEYQRFGKQPGAGHPRSFLDAPTEFEGIESGSKYNAVEGSGNWSGTQIIDDPILRSRRPGYGPKPVSATEYYKELPIERAAYITGRLGTRPNVRRPRE